MKALLIQHKEAGRGDASRKALMSAIEQAGWKKVAYLPRGKADASAIGDAKADLIVVAGGDGTVAAIVKMLPDRSVPLAIIPTGTANNIARSLGICGKPEDIVCEWDLDRRQRLDLGNAHGPWGCLPFAEGIGFGAFADSLRLAPDAAGREKMERGREALRKAVRSAAALPLDVLVDGEKLPGGMLLLEIMNVPLTGPRLMIASDASPGDGRLHVSWLAGAKREAMLRWLKDATSEPPLEQCPAREIEVRGGGAAMRIDDESRWLNKGSRVTIRLEGEPVQILAPADVPALAG